MNFIRAFVLVSIVTLPSVTLRADASSTIRFTHTVPLRCSVETVSAASGEDGVVLVVDERCNNGRGYTLHLHHAPGDIRSLRYDGRKITLSQNGQTLIARSPTARDHRSRIEIDAVRSSDFVLVLAP